MIDEVLEKYEYPNHKQEEVCRNYVQVVDEAIVGSFDYEGKRLTSRLYNSQYIANIEQYLKDNTEYYGVPDSKGRYHKLSDKNVLLREYVFYLPEDAGDMFREDEDMYKAWCDDNLEWFRRQFPTFHVVASVGHFTTEKTPHMQILFIPLDEKGKLNNNKYFYDMDDSGKTHRTGKIKQSDREQSYIDEVLSKYDIEGGIKGSGAKHNDLDQHCSNLKHQAKAISQEVDELIVLHDRLATDAVQELKDYDRLKDELGRLARFVEKIFGVLNEISRFIPTKLKQKLNDVIDDFFNNEQPEQSR